MVKVYFENLSANGTSNYAVLVAIFIDEETYDASRPALVSIANQNNYIVTESVDEEVDLADLEDLASLDVLTQLKQNKS
jgi:hypothetical protein